ncbi:unnamed protein product [Diabrotica balteata]|uniref:Uncharacterized protein n=1 Tax=Diabrotica balteata TaxID=107213 RepID=A0A9N9XB13_DIABA|nr:unnamed protein product [Diabrotica balteata]
MFVNRILLLELMIKALRCYVFSTLFSWSESWILKVDNIKKFESFEMWCYRRILKTLWTQRVTNAEVLRRLQNNYEVIKHINTRKMEYLGYITRGAKYGILRLIMQTKIQGKRSIGRRRISWLRNLIEWYRCCSVDLFRAAANKVRIAVMIANLR